MNASTRGQSFSCFRDVDEDSWGANVSTKHLLHCPRGPLSSTGETEPTQSPLSRGRRHDIARTNVPGNQNRTGAVSFRSILFAASQSDLKGTDGRRRRAFQVERHSAKTSTCSASLRDCTTVSATLSDDGD